MVCSHRHCRNGQLSVTQQKAKAATAHLGRLERVVSRKRDVKPEDPARIRRIGCAHDGGFPIEGVVSLWPSAAADGRVLCHVIKLLRDAAGGLRCAVAGPGALEYSRDYVAAGVESRDEIAAGVVWDITICRKPPPQSPGASPARDAVFFWRAAVLPPKPHFLQTVTKCI
eukprot:scaffold14337_cov132-Isochrysis_galbana.AAC.5